MAQNIERIIYSTIIQLNNKIYNGSMYKLLWKEMLIFLTMFYSLNLSYRYLMNQQQRNISGPAIKKVWASRSLQGSTTYNFINPKSPIFPVLICRTIMLNLRTHPKKTLIKNISIFERVTMYCDAFIDFIPLSFVLGFFVSTVVSRWWAQFECIPWPDEAAIAIGCMIVGGDDKEESRLIRRTLIRYLNLMPLLVYRSISIPVMKRFPTMEHIVDAGFMTESELTKLQDIPLKNSKWWAPNVWYSILLSKAYDRGLLIEQLCYRELFQYGADIRKLCQRLTTYDWVNIPLVYTQVVTLANYTFYVTCLMGRQMLDPRKKYPKHEEIYFPIFTFLQFFFYMGWFKVAEGLLNPFGEDEDDFDMNRIIDRNLRVSYLAVDRLHNDPPLPEKDMHWNDADPTLPYTVSTEKFNKSPWIGSTANLPLGPEDMKVVTKRPSIFGRFLDRGTSQNCNKKPFALSSTWGHTAAETSKTQSKNPRYMTIPESVMMDTSGDPMGSANPTQALLTQELPSKDSTS